MRKNAASMLPWWGCCSAMLLSMYQEPQKLRHLLNLLLSLCPGPRHEDTTPRTAPHDTFLYVPTSSFLL